MKNRITIFVFIGLLLFSCSKKEEKKEIPSYPIRATKAVIKDALIYIEAIGHVKSIASINIKSRIEGELLNVYFKEGQDVKEGDILFTIDPRPYEAELEKMKATLAENKANLLLAKDKVTRYSALVKEEYISELDFDQLNTNVAKYEAIVKQNQAQVEEARINLEYCQIYSPINGTTGILQIDKGNLIPKEGTTPLININQISPIYVEFSIPEKDFQKVRKYNDIEPLKVRSSYDDIEYNYHEGILEMFDSSINKDVGMIKLRAIYKNEKKQLWPGEYVQTRVILTTQKNAVIIPYQAVIIASSGNLVFVVKEDNTVEMRKVKLGQREDENIIILEGLKGDETVVTDGQINLFDGAHIHYTTIKEEK